jgi:hypothetical protein
MSIAPTEYAAEYKAGGVFTLEHPGPELPADTSTNIPDACVLFTIVSSSPPVVHPSLTGQPQLLMITSGRKAGFGF